MAICTDPAHPFAGPSAGVSKDWSVPIARMPRRLPCWLTWSHEQSGIEGNPVRLIRVEKWFAVLFLIAAPAGDAHESIRRTHDLIDLLARDGRLNPPSLRALCTAMGPNAVAVAVQARLAAETPAP